MKTLWIFLNLQLDNQNVLRIKGFHLSYSRDHKLRLKIQASILTINIKLSKCSKTKVPLSKLMNPKVNKKYLKPMKEYFNKSSNTNIIMI